LVFIAIGFLVNYFATSYATERAGNSVTDIVLSNIPIFDMDGSFVVGPIIFWIIIAYFLLRSPNKIPFTMNSVALLLIVRSIFISLTHLGPFPGRMIITHDVLGLFSSGGDLFFSGHTATPFLIALIFWDDMKMRVFCLLSSVFFGVIVLLAHVHYSIDVAAAFFITYTIYHLATKYFKYDLELFNMKPVKIQKASNKK
jgi:membrane-associated phospholipid phosphatase